MLRFAQRTPDSTCNDLPIQIVIFSNKDTPKIHNDVDKLFTSIFKDTIYTKGPVSVVPVLGDIPHKKVFDILCNITKTKGLGLLSTASQRFRRIQVPVYTGIGSINEIIKKLKINDTEFDSLDYSYFLNLELSFMLRYGNTFDDEIQGLGLIIPEPAGNNHSAFFFYKTFENDSFFDVSKQNDIECASYYTVRFAITEPEAELEISKRLE